MPDYNFDINDNFLKNLQYLSLSQYANRKGDNKSLPFYKNQSGWNISTYYPDYTAEGDETSEEYVHAFEQNYAPYGEFTNYIKNSFSEDASTENQERIAQIRKYFNWLDLNAGAGTEGKLGIDQYYDETGKRTANWDAGKIESMLALYSQRRNDGKFGYYHLGPINPSVPTIPDVPVELPQEQPKQYYPIKPNPKAPYKYPGWSDWIPLTMQRILDSFNIAKQNQLEKLKKFPLIDPKQHNYKITNGYAERQLIDLQKAELRNAALLDQSTDINLNIKRRMAIEDLIDQLNNKLIGIKSNEFARTTKEGQTVADWNSDERVDTANINRQSLTAAWNNILNANLKMLERDTASRKLYIGDMYTNYGEYLKTKRLNEDARKSFLAKNLYNSDLYEIRKPFDELRQDPTKWNQIQLFCRDLFAQGNENFYNDPTALKISAALKAGTLSVALKDPEIKQWVIAKLSDPNTDNPTVKSYQLRYKLTLKEIQELVATDSLQAKQKYNDVMAGINAFETNQWGIPIVDKSYRRSTLMPAYKSGSKIDKLSNFAQLYLKELDSVRKRNAQTHKEISNDLNKQLDRISKELLLLLRAVFK